MVRKTREEAAGTREALLDAAEHLFRERGVARTSLADIAEAAGLTRGAVYWHFRDKADLYDAMCGRATLPLEEMLECAGTTRHDDPLGALRQLCVTSLTRLATDERSQAVFDVMFRKCDMSELGVPAERSASTDRACHRHVERVLRQAIARGQLPAGTDATLAAQGLHAYMIGLMHQWVQDPAAFDLGRASPALVDLWIAGLVAAPPRTAHKAHASRQRTAA